jgi:hypothetical protein
MRSATTKAVYSLQWRTSARDRRVADWSLKEIAAGLTARQPALANNRFCLPVRSWLSKTTPRLNYWRLRALRLLTTSTNFNAG